MQSLDQQDLNDLESSGSDEEMDEEKIMERECMEEEEDMGGLFGDDSDEDEDEDSDGSCPLPLM